MSDDRIVYTVVSAPGGVDGMDNSDKGGVVVLATFNKEEALKRIGQDSRYTLVPTVVDIADAVRKLRAKLSKMELLILPFLTKSA